MAGSLTVEAETTVAVSVGAGTAEVGDYSIPAGQETFDVVIAAGTGLKSGTFPITTITDTVVAEADALEITGTATGFTVNEASLTITDTGTITLSVDADSTTAEVDNTIGEGVSDRSVKVTASVSGGGTVESDTTISVSVGAGSAEASDYSIPDGDETFDVTIAADAGSGSDTFPLSTVDDSVAGETDVLSITGTTTADGLTVSPASLEITDSGSTIDLTVDVDSGETGDQTSLGEGVSGRTVTVTAKVSGGGTVESETTVRVSVGAGTAEGSDYSIPSGQETFDVVIPAGAGSKSATFTLTTYTDNVVAEADALQITGTATGFTVNEASLTIIGGGTIDLSVDADSGTSGDQTSIDEGVSDRTVTVTATAPMGGVVEAETSVSVSVGGGHGAVVRLFDSVWRGNVRCGDRGGWIVGVGDVHAVHDGRQRCR